LLISIDGSEIFRGEMKKKGRKSEKSEKMKKGEKNVT